MAFKKKDKSKKEKSSGSKDPTSKLKALQKKWKTTQPKTFGKQAPDGDYEVKIVSAVLEQAKSESKRLQVVWALKILEGDCKDRELTHRSGLEGSEDCLAYFQGELETLELELPDDISDIGGTLQEAIGLELEISLSTRNEFQNVRFNELLEASGDYYEDEEDEDEEEEEEEEEETDDDDDEEEEEEEDEAEPYPTTAELKKMKKPDLLTLIEDYELDVDDPADLSLKELRAAVIEASVEDEEEDEEEEEDDD